MKCGWRVVVGDWFFCRWLRYTYCRKHGHRPWGAQLSSDYCRNCGKDTA